jgi:uncharacterized protein YheU (UPF0270 family)
MSDDEGRDQGHEDDDAGEGDELPPEVEIPWERLSAEALRGVIEEFVTREGTDYGPSDVALDAKVAQVRRQLERGEVVLRFDARSQSANLVRSDERGSR